MKLDLLTMSRNGDDLGVPPNQDGAAPVGNMLPPGVDAQMYMQSLSDSQFRNSNSTSNNTPNLAALGANFGAVSQGAQGNMNPSQAYLEEHQRRLMFLDQAQRSQNSMLLRQSEYGQLSAAARNQFMNQQMLLSQSNGRPLMMDPLLSAGGSPSAMGTTINPEMLYGPGGNLRQQAPSMPGLLPQHSVGNFPGGGIAPSIHQQHLHAMNQMSSIMNASALDRSSAAEMAAHEAAAAAQGRSDAPIGFPRGEDKKETARDMPIRPLSAYNFFFRDERERILADDDGKKEEDLSPESLEKKKKLLLEQHLLKDRSRRRPHRKTHGKIGFTTLSKLIGKRWRELPEERKQYYRDVAAMDMDRYQRDVADYNKGRLFQKPPK